MNYPKQSQTWYTILEAKDYLRISVSTLRNAIKAGNLKATRSNGNVGKIILHISWLDEFILRGDAK